MKTQAHLGRHHLVRRHGAAHGRDDFEQQLRVFQQGRAPAVAIDDFGRAAKVQVHAISAQARHARCVVGQAMGV